MDIKKTAAKNSEAKFAPDAAAGVRHSTGAEAQPKKTEAEEIVDTLSHRYHRNLRLFMDWDNDDVLQIYLTSLAHVYDPHSDYFNRAQLDSFAIGMNLSLFGIGAELTSEDGYCTIRRLLPGGPGGQEQEDQGKRPHRRRGAEQPAAGGRGGHEPEQGGPVSSADPRARRCG